MRRTSKLRPDTVEECAMPGHQRAPGLSRNSRGALDYTPRAALQPEFFGGFEVAASGAQLATAEIALVDLLCLSPGRSRLFAALPEVEVPRAFRRSVARSWARKVPSARLRAIVERKLEVVLRGAAFG